MPRHLLTTRTATWVLFAGIAAIIVWLYWPAHSASFAWDDRTCLHDAPWLRQGSMWRDYVFSGFCNWRNYFRPLVVLLYSAEMHLFNATPGPAHIVSIALHLINSALIGWLALIMTGQRRTETASRVLSAGAMLIYGLHPALIGSVAWISVQFDQVVTLFTLMGLITNAQIRRTWLRAIAVASCFFLAACAKELAATFPLILVLFDWANAPDGECGNVRRLRTLLRRQAPVYAGVLLAGIAYLALRAATMGFLVHGTGHESLFSLNHWQAAAAAYLRYLRILFWPMYGLGPIHIVNSQRFAMLNATNLIADLAALAIFAGAFIGTWKRKRFAYPLLAATLALLPVLHLVPIPFDPSLYHERYTTEALAFALSLLPIAIISAKINDHLRRSVMATVVPVLVVWLIFAVINIRVTLPLWSNDLTLWRWVVAENPGSFHSKSHLLSAYMDNGQLAAARKLSSELMKIDAPCAECMINVANLALQDHDIQLAGKALARARQSAARHPSNSMVVAYIMTLGRLRETRGDLHGAEQAFRDAATLDASDPRARFFLALTLAKQGRIAQARRQADIAIALFAPDERTARRREFERALSAKPAIQPHP